MTTEEKELDLGVLVEDFEGASSRLDALVRDNKDDPAALAVALAGFMQNDLVVLVKDLATATLLGMQELEDQVSPFEISQADREEQIELLLAYRAQNAANPQLLEKIDGQLEALEYDPEDEGAEEEEEQEEAGDPGPDEDEDEDDEDLDDEDDEDQDDDEE